MRSASAVSPQAERAPIAADTVYGSFSAGVPGLCFDWWNWFRFVGVDQKQKKGDTADGTIHQGGAEAVMRKKQKREKAVWYVVVATPRHVVILVQ